MRGPAVRLAVCAAIAALPCAAAARAGELRAVGVLGNSGQAGPSLVRTTPYPGGMLPTGVAVADDCTLWVGAGQALNHLSLSGELLERRPLVPAGSAVDSTTFALLGETIYFFARTPAGAAALFALPTGGDAPARALPIALPPRKQANLPCVLVPQALDGKLLLVNEPPPGGSLDVLLVDPAAGAISKAFSVKGSQPHGAAVDAKNRVIYVGANSILALRPDGSSASEHFPIACMKTPAIPTQFRGTISLAGGAIWDSAWYGFLSRHSTDGRNAPGRVVEWHHELGFPKQIAEVGGSDGPYGPLLITTAAPGALYYAHWNRPKMRLEFVRRLGCLPNVYSLALSEEGWVTVGTATCQLWWRWDDAADDPPRAAKLHVAVTPPFFAGERCLAVAAQYDVSRKADRKLTVFTPALGDRNEARRHSDVAMPLAEPVGLSARPAPKGATDLYLTDAATRSLWRCGLWVDNLRPDGKWRPVMLEEGEWTAPTDVVALTDGRLIVADAGRVVMLEKGGDIRRIAWQLREWGQAPVERFGRRLRLAVDGPWMLVADTDRHRVVWMDWTSRQVLGVFGETDKPGDDLSHVHSPAQVSLRETRAVVADVGNQRVLKLALEP